MSFPICHHRGIRNWRSVRVWPNAVPLQLKVEMGVLSINLNCKSLPQKKKGPKYTLPFFIRLPEQSKCQPRQKKEAKGNKAAVFTQSRSPLSSSEAMLCQLGAGKMTLRSISLQKEQCVCEQASTSHDRAKCTFYTVALPLPRFIFAVC